MAGCTAKQPHEIEVQYSYQDNYEYFGYITNWVRNVKIPPTPKNTHGAKADFNQCIKETKERLIDHRIPRKEIQLAFVVECMAKKDWFLYVSPYMATG